jgi:hypothetical protein
MILTREKRISVRPACPSDTFYTTHLTRTALLSNLDICDEKRLNSVHKTSQNSRNMFQCVNERTIWNLSEIRGTVLRLLNLATRSGNSAFFSPNCFCSYISDNRQRSFPWRALTVSCFRFRHNLYDVRQELNFCISEHILGFHVHSMARQYITVCLRFEIITEGTWRLWHMGWHMLHEDIYEN